MRRRSGLTRIEQLLVVAIGALLIALLSPLLAGVWDRVHARSQIARLR